MPAPPRLLQGIQTDFLPTSTVPLKTVEVPGCREANFAGGLH